MLTIFSAALGSLFVLAVAAFVVACIADATRPFRRARALVKLARTYGIEYVPGEDLDALRARVVARRDAYLTPDKR